MIEWITNLNKASEQNKKEIYFLQRDGDQIVSTGIIQIVNFTDNNPDEGCINNNIFKQSLGQIFLLNNNETELNEPIENTLEYKIYSIRTAAKLKYPLNSLLYINYILEKSIYYHYNSIEMIWFDIKNKHVNNIIQLYNNYFL